MPDQIQGEPAFVFKQLPRGGTLVESQTLRLQIGSYPETIKDTLTSERGVPDLYLLPDDLFDTDLGLSNADLEFPVYYNFFMHRRPCRLICHRHQLRALVRVLREAVFGPLKLELENEYPQGAATPGFPDLSREMALYKEDASLPGGRLRLKHMLELHLFDSQGQVEIQGVRIRSLGRNRYRLENHLGHGEWEFRSTRPPFDSQEIPSGEGSFTPPTFGVTVIGSGHGFDVHSKTSGFIIWVDGKGILVDPPVNSTVWMKQHRIDARLIEDLILTHCHADHDSGTLQKVLEEGRIRIHTTETVMRSFVTKYATLIRITPQDFRALFEFVPLTIGARTTIAGARFRFRYTLHPIPTLGFDAEFEGGSLYYSCDTLYDPQQIARWHERGVLSQSRMQCLLDVPWQSDLILHEAGIPPIHTPLSVLEALPEAVKQRLFLVHISAEAIPPDSGLRLAGPGPSHSMVIDVPPPPKSLASRILDVICHIDLFAELKLRRAAEFLAVTHRQVYQPGEVLIARHTPGDRFFMIASGEVEILHEDLPRRLIFGRYDYLGETALILDQPRNADVIARTLTEVLYIEREDFLRLIYQTPLPDIFRRLETNRSAGARWTFEHHRILARLSPWQKTQLLCSMRPATLNRGQQLFQDGDRVTHFYLIDRGTVRVRSKQSQGLFGPGSLIGSYGASMESTHHTFSAWAEEELAAYLLEVQDIHAFFHANPGTFVRLARDFADHLYSHPRPATDARATR